MNSGNSTDISYLVNTPSVSQSNDYQFINSSISYRFNSSFSRLSVDSISGILDLDLDFEKYQQQVLSGDNATWRITSSVLNPSDITVNLTSVTLWVSVRNGTGTGFTNPSLIDTDTVSGATLEFVYNPFTLLNSSTGEWNNSAAEWFFNYTFSSSPIVWMDLNNTIVDDGIQLSNRTITYGNNEIYVKEIYLATGYWLEIDKNITRLSNNTYSINVTVVNRGSSPTPAGQVVMVYNFIPNTFNLTSPFMYSSSSWYNTTVANETLNDPIYNGTMYQYGLLPNGNPSDSSLDSYGGSFNSNNTWSVTYNVSGSGDFNFDDLFLTGVDPLNVKEYGSTKALSIENAYEVLSAKGEYILGVVAVIVGLLVLFM